MMNLNEQQFDAEVVEGLVGAEQQPAYQAMQRGLALWEKQEAERALAPGLTNDQRNYFSGGAQCLMDFRRWIEQHAAQAKLAQVGKKKRPAE